MKKIIITSLFIFLTILFPNILNAQSSTFIPKQIVSLCTSPDEYYNYKRQQDIKRLLDIHQIATLIEEYKSKAGYYPFEDSFLKTPPKGFRAVPVSVIITTIKLPKRYRFPPGGISGNVFANKSRLEDELSKILKKTIILPEDPDEIEGFSPNFYQYYFNGKNYYISANLFYQAKGSIKKAEHNFKYQFGSEFLPDKGIFSVSANFDPNSIVGERDSNDPWVIAKATCIEEAMQQVQHLTSLGRYHKAQSLMKEFIPIINKQLVNYPDVINNKISALGYFFLQSGNPARAKDLCKSSSSYRENSANRDFASLSQDYNCLRFAAILDGNTNEAEKYAEKIITLLPNIPEKYFVKTLIWLANHYYEVENKTKALEYYKQTIVLLERQKSENVLLLTEVKSKVALLENNYEDSLKGFELLLKKAEYDLDPQEDGYIRRIYDYAYTLKKAGKKTEATEHCNKIKEIIFKMENDASYIRRKCEKIEQ